MKIFSRLLILSLAILLSSIASYAEDPIFEIKANPVIQTDNSNDTVTHIIIKNNTNSTKYVGIKVFMEDIAPDHLIWLCIIQTCLEPRNTDFTSSRVIKVEANSESPENYMKITILSDDKPGYNRVRYRFYDDDDSTNYVDYTQEYFIGMSSVNERESPVTLTMPNPTPGDLFINLKDEFSIGESRINIFNESGSLVKTMSATANSNQIHLNVDDLHNGAYYYDMIINGRHEKGSRFIVQK